MKVYFKNGESPRGIWNKIQGKKVINLVLGKIWPPLDLLFLEWSYYSLVNTRSDANYNTSVKITLIWLLSVADSGMDIRHLYNTISYRVIVGNWYYLMSYYSVSKAIWEL